ncbi:hypothetical protein TVAG_045900 [Trichomonas vaginalis G3]|uniref:Uncharacterized protein n=1 Tax=Trichomonas vaginalis (strain ATCC PRA-98 / G3) TaxID=412133 RepID=A2DMG1_TRIV3|nr:hypothetical protein TVAGG3_0336940 [Trichomonas vaginalis G3]EAY18388.1 hypothetical protein TVAG_045900 [Trichomonas vaginalis G3]KAI5530342.1 hypothetical protein TVAGG3_0336940 [Trichomonas vaginalis G3]|eukprot:XP_001579374.1 hypothetical protein [Trichomonas vaginalis G3]
MDDETKQIIAFLRSQERGVKRSVDKVPMPKSYVKEMNYVQNELSKPTQPDNFHIDHEWAFHFVTWFANLRHHFETTYNEPEKFIDYENAIKNIRQNMQPTPYSVSKSTSSMILTYFQKRNTNFTENELIWVFNCFIFIDQLLSPDICVVMQNIQTLIYKQMQELENNDKLFSQLAIISIIITNYFKQ